MANNQNRRDFLKTAGLTVAALAAQPRWLKAAESSAKRPNVVFIMADDMGIGDVGCYNPDSKIPTPNMDRLATEGVLFTDAHSPSAVCTPTRYGVLTGRYCWRSRLKSQVLYGYEPPLIEPERMTIASLLKQHGYKTACIGKWHLGLHWAVKPGNDIDFNKPLPWDEEQNLTATGQDKFIDFTRPIKGGPNDLGFDYAYYTSGCSTVQPPYCFIENDRTVGILEFMERRTETSPDKPFLLYFALSAPHAPWLPPDFVKGRSKAGPRGDQVVLVDWCVGQILQALDRLNLRDNTLVIVTSDNGPRIGVKGHKSAGLWRGYKSHIWEGGHREPFIARWPGKIKPNTESDELISFTDLMATCAAIVGTSLPDNAGEDSYNILPAFLSEKFEKPIRPDIIHHSVWGVFSIRKGKWKLILDTRGSGGWVRPRDEYPVPGTPGQLYNVEEDPYETTNLWDSHSEIVESLTKLLQKYKKQGYSRPMSG
jgi:arylsulfatase A-like enzyme